MGTVTSITEARGKRDQVVVFERGDHVELAGKLIESLTCMGPAGATPAVYADGHVWRYDELEHIYRPIDPRVLRQIVHQFAGTMVHSGEKPRPLKVNAGLASGVITVAQDQLYEVDYFSNALMGLTFANGFVTVAQHEINVRGHSPAHRARFRYAFNFDHNAVPSKFLEFLGQVFRDDSDAEDKRKLLQEYIGISMLGEAARYQRMLILLGRGANGKSVFQRIAEAAMPTASVCSIAPQTFGQEYRRAMLAGKLLNIVSELPDAVVLDSANFKAVIAGDPIVGRHIYGVPFTFRPVAGHLCSANRLPESADQSHGFWRRMLVLSFNRVFSESEQNASLADDLIANELPAIVSWFVIGAQRVLRQGGYTIPASHQAALDKWRHDADPVRAFAEERLTLVDDDKVMLPSRIIYATYRAWCAENGYRALAINRFGERMKVLQMCPRHTMNGSFYAVGLRA